MCRAPFARATHFVSERSSIQQTRLRALKCRKIVGEISPSAACWPWPSRTMLDCSEHSSPRTSTPRIRVGLLVVPLCLQLQVLIGAGIKVNEGTTSSRYKKVCAGGSGGWMNGWARHVANDRLYLGYDAEAQRIGLLIQVVHSRCSHEGPASASASPSKKCLRKASLSGMPHTPRVTGWLGCRVTCVANSSVLDSNRAVRSVARTKCRPCSRI